MTDEKRHFMYVMTPTDPAKAASRDNWTPHDFETFELHMAHLNGLLAADKLVLAGRTLDAGGKGPAVVIFEAGSSGEAERIFEAEPFITRGFCTATLHPFSTPIVRGAE